MEYANLVIQLNGENGKYMGMDAERIAKEIYAHAVIFYGLTPFIAYISDPITVNSINEIIQKARKIEVNLNESVDRLIIYNILWSYAYEK